MCLENKKTTGDWYILKSGSKYIKLAIRILIILISPFFTDLK